MDTNGKADVTLDSLMENASPELTGSRRPGNLWTAQAREDMFRRREAGETWETICLDYPKRSRHAMQQQYSMMKKQRALANGTWTSNRRGRKRRNPSPEKWPSLARRQQSRDTPDDELTEDDEFADLDSEDGMDFDDTDSNFRDDSLTNGRPTPLARAITDPVARTARSKIVTFPNLPSSAGLSASTINGSNPTISIDRVPDHPDLVNSGYPPKRRKTSPALATKLEAPTPPVPTSMPPPETFIPASVAYDREEVQEFLNRGIEKARILASHYESEKLAQRKTFEASIGRFSRRTHDAQERLRYALHEHADTLKAREREFAENMKNQAREHLEEKQIMRREFDKDQRQREDIQTKNIDSLRRQNDELKRQIENLQRVQREQQEQRDFYEHEIACLKKQSHPSEASGPTPPAGPDVAKVMAPIQDSSQQDSLAEKLEQRERRYEASHAKLNEGVLDNWQGLEKEIKEHVSFATAEYDSLSQSINRLNNDFEDMSNKQLIKTLGSLQLQNEATQGMMKGATNMIEASFENSKEALLMVLDGPQKETEPSIS